jgi:subtilisin family serine protease
MHARPARRLLLAAALASALVAVAVASAATGANGHSARRAKAGSILVGFKPGVTAPAQADVLADAGAKPTKKFAPIHGALVSVAPGSTAQTINELNRDPRVAYAEPNFILHAADVFPNDQFFSRLWGLHNTGQNVNFTAGTPDADIDAPEAWSVSTGSSGVVVAVIDTGVDMAHPDIAPNIWVNAGEDCPGCRTNGVDDDGNGYVDDWRGWDFANGDNNPTDDNGHGTHVSGTVAATGNNGLGVAGVTWSSRIMPLKFLGSDGSGTTDDAISAILYARAKGVPILSNSWGGGEASQALLDAIQQTDASGELSWPPRATTSRTPTSSRSSPRATTCRTCSSSARATSSIERPGSRTTGRAPSTCRRRGRTSTRRGSARPIASPTGPRWRRRRSRAPRPSRRRCSRVRAASA